MNTCLFTKFIMPWYNSTYNGTICMTLSIFNLLTLPYLNYYEATDNEDGQVFFLKLQFRLNIFYLLELLLCVFVLGIYEVLTKETVALRFEAVF